MQNPLVKIFVNRNQSIKVNHIHSQLILQMFHSRSKKQIFPTLNFFHSYEKQKTAFNFLFLKNFTIREKFTRKNFKVLKIHFIFENN